MLRRAAREIGSIGDGSAMDDQTIGDIIISIMHRRFWHKHRRCVADVSGTFLTLVYIAECSPTARRCSAIYRQWYLASKHREKISMHALKFFSMLWRIMTITRVHRRSFAEPKFVHRESFGRLKKPRGTVALTSKQTLPFGFAVYKWKRPTVYKCMGVYKHSPEVFINERTFLNGRPFINGWTRTWLITVNPLNCSIYGGTKLAIAMATNLTYSHNIADNRK